MLKAISRFWLGLRGYPRKIDRYTTEVTPGNYVLRAPAIDPDAYMPRGWRVTVWRNGQPMKFERIEEGGR